MNEKRTIDMQALLRQRGAAGPSPGRLGCIAGPSFIGGKNLWRK